MTKRECRRSHGRRSCCLCEGMAGEGVRRNHRPIEEARKVPSNGQSRTFSTRKRHLAGRCTPHANVKEIASRSHPCRPRREAVLDRPICRSMRLVVCITTEMTPFWVHDASIHPVGWRPLTLAWPPCPAAAALSSAEMLGLPRRVRLRERHYAHLRYTNCGAPRYCSAHALGVRHRT